MIKLRYTDEPVEIGDWIYYINFSIATTSYRLVIPQKPGSTIQDVIGLLSGDIENYHPYIKKVSIVPTEEGIYNDVSLPGPANRERFSKGRIVRPQGY